MRAASASAGALRDSQWDPFGGVKRIRIPRILSSALSCLCLAILGNSAGAQNRELTSWVFGSGSPVVVVLHGGPGVGHSYLLPEWKQLEEVFTVVFYDQRGCGENAGFPGPYSWQQHISDLDALIRHHRRGRPVVLAGSSWGAGLALLHGLEGTEEIAGIIVSGFVGWMGKQSTPDHLLARLDSLERGLPVDPWPEPDTLSSGHGIGGHVADSIVLARVVDPANPRSISDVFDSRTSMPSQKELAGLKTPVLIISGDRDGRHYDAGGHLAKILQHAERMIIRNAVHDPWAADPKAFFGAVADFLKGLGLS